MFESFKENYRFAKNNVNKTRFVFNYIVLPSAGLFGLVDFLLAVLFLGLKGTGFFVTGIVLICLLVAVAIALPCCLPYVQKKDIEANVAKLKEFFDTPLLKNPETEYVLPRGNEPGVVDMSFEEKGFKIDNLEYSYDAFDCALYTSNYMYSVNLIIVFKRTDIGNAEDGENKGVVEFSLPLDINLMTLMEKHNLKIVNPDVLTFIRENIETAVKQVLKYGKIQNGFYDVK